MPSDLETLIREVLTEQASRAPHRATVLAGMRWGTRRPYRRLVMVATGVAVALAVIGIPVGLHLTSHPRPATPPPPVLANRPTDIPIPYRVTWVPSGYVASMRAGSPPAVRTGMMLQYWEPRGVDRATTDPSGSSPYIDFRYSRLSSDAGLGQGARDISVNGATGKLTHDTSGRADDGRVLDKAYLWWEPSAGVALSVTVVNVPDPTDVATRVARSVVSGGVGIPQALTFGDLPGNYYADYLQIDGTSATNFTVTRIALEHGGGLSHYIATWSTSEPSLTRQTAVTVRGRPGWFGQSPLEPTEWGVSVRLDPGHWLAVRVMAPDGSPVATPAQVVPIANGMSMFPAGSFDWLGR